MSTRPFDPTSLPPDLGRPAGLEGRRVITRRDCLMCGGSVIVGAGAVALPAQAQQSSRVGGISIPSTLAVFKLIMSSNLVGCSTGRSALSMFPYIVPKGAQGSYGSCTGHTSVHIPAAYSRSRKCDRSWQ